MIKIDHLCCNIGGKKILDDITLDIREGEFTAILGRNGSGKSTLAKHLNALMRPSSGSVTVDGADTAETANVFEVRKRVGTVFQNPDSQAVASIVEDDTAFAPENMGLPESETNRRIDEALKAVGLDALRHRAISTLSGGQKQITAIAGVLAMEPRYTVFDEGTSMLDPAARKQVLECARDLQKKRGMAVIWITHYMDEAVNADRVIVLDGGRVKADGTPEEILSSHKIMADSGLELTVCAEISSRLASAGLPRTVLTPDELADEIESRAKRRAASAAAGKKPCRNGGEKPIVRLKNVSYVYKTSGTETAALKSVTADIFPGITAIAGRTGSGKSTLLELLAGLSEPTSGELASDAAKRSGMVFQYPEYQLFEDTVYNDIAYGAKNVGLSGDALDRRVRRAARLVGLPEEELAKNPFTLSGGRKRLAAIAGILAVRPDILLLDEPAAGLDPAGRRKIFELLRSLAEENPSMAIVFVTHSMDDAAEHSDYIAMLESGELVMYGASREIFADAASLPKCAAAALPTAAVLRENLRGRGFVTDDFSTIDGACECIENYF